MSDLIQAGKQYACRWLVLAHENLDSALVPEERKIVAEKAAELAFRCCLSTLEIPYTNAENNPLRNPVHVDVLLDGTR